MAYFDKYGVEFSDDRKTLVRCPEDFQGEYVIPNSVTSINDYAFSCCIGLTSVEVPDSVTSIGECAFCLVPNIAYNGTATGSPWDARSVNGYVDGLLVYSDNTKTVLLACSSTAIGEITIPNSVTSIDDYAFYGCSGLTSVEIPNSVRNIGYKVFAGCKGLSSATIPDSVTSIGFDAFRDCTGITSVIIPKNLTKIESGVFRGCSSLTSIVWNVKNCPDFSSKETLFREYVDEAGEYAFDMSAQIKSFSFGDEVERIPAYLCYETKITAIEIPNSVKNIGYKAFAGCFCLESVTIPNSVTSIGDYAFSGCGWLKEIFVPLGQEERFCRMPALEKFVAIIRQTSEKRKEQLRQQEREAQEQQRLQVQQLQEMLQDSILFFDTETTGVPKLYNASVTDSGNWPRLVQLAWLMADKNGNILKRNSVIIKPDGFSIPSDASAVHGITTERAQREGKPLDAVLEEFMNDVQLASSVVGHNIDFDMHIVGAELYRLDMDYDLFIDKPCICTMKSSTDFCAIPNPNSYFGGYKWPSLQELYRKLFNCDFADAHDALADITATKECYFELRKRGII